MQSHCFSLPHIYPAMRLFPRDVRYPNQDRLLTDDSRSYGGQALMQLAGLGLGILIPVISGAIVGKVLSIPGLGQALTIVLTRDFQASSSVSASGRTSATTRLSPTRSTSRFRRTSTSPLGYAPVRLTLTLTLPTLAHQPRQSH